jgi:hypothetical protein
MSKFSENAGCCHTTSCALPASSAPAGVPAAGVRQRTASCCCGQLSITCNEDPIRCAICHCTECQKRSGSVFGVQARFNRLATVVAGNATAYTRTADSGHKVTFHFCPQCGSTLYWHLENICDFVIIAVGNFADASFPAPVFSVYGDRCHKWVMLPGDIEQMS